MADRSVASAHVNHRTGPRPTTNQSEPVAQTTAVELIWIKGHIEHWIRFGQPVAEQRLDRQRRILHFARGSVFAFVRWQANDYGTVLSRIDILRTLGPCESSQTIPGVAPGGELLLRLHGWPVVERVLQAIDQVEATGIDPAKACPDHWRHVHNRITAREQPRRYSRQRHKAFLLRRKVMP